MSLSHWRKLHETSACCNRLVSCYSNFIPLVFCLFLSRPGKICYNSDNEMEKISSTAESCVCHEEWTDILAKPKPCPIECKWKASQDCNSAQLATDEFCSVRTMMGSSIITRVDRGGHQNVHHLPTRNVYVHPS